jgi:hypothetical protein
VKTKNEFTVFRVYEILESECCNKCILGIAEVHSVWEDPNEMSIQYETHYPLTIARNEYDTSVVPPDVCEDLLEALKCFGAEAYKASSAMCGRALDSICKHKKAKGGNLEEKIDYLYKNGVITSSLVLKMAHKVRDGRNHGIHPPRGNKESTIQDWKGYAHSLIELTRLMIDAIYVARHFVDTFDPKGGASA